MGAISFSIPKELVLRLRDKAGIDTFVETGTFKGGTCFWAAKHFKNIYTIEIIEEISKRTSSNPSCPNNINFLIGNSKDLLPKLTKDLPPNTLFWLDGHWCGGNTGGANEVSPIYDEIIAASLCHNAVLFIDDARAFLGNLNDNSEYYPSIDELFSLLKLKFPLHYSTIVDDVIITIPQEYKYILDDDWRKYYSYRYNKYFRLLNQKFFIKAKTLMKKFI